MPLYFKPTHFRKFSKTPEHAGEVALSKKTVKITNP